MGKVTGFLEFERQEPQQQDPHERLLHWEEFQHAMDPASLAVQGARCMDCGTPFCHSGMLIEGMASGCPVNNLIPEWNDLVYRGRWREASERLHKTNNFPEFTGRVCPAPCEASCTLGIIEPPVTIKTIERTIVDRAFSAGWIIPRVPSYRTGKQVAVVGSGPAGLACADQLNQVGHHVTVFERADRVGGLLMYGIPNMKLAKTLVQRRVDLLAAEGIRFVTNTEVGTNYASERLIADFDAVVLCAGATSPRDLPIPERDVEGVHFAMDFLRDSTVQLLATNGQHADSLSAKDKDVIVIGGGDTGTDCVATALRQQCKSVTQLEIMAKLPTNRQPHNPWPQWPMVHRTDYGQQEASVVFEGDPRQYATMTKEFVEEGGRVTGVKTVAVHWTTDCAGKRLCKEVPHSEKTWPADLVFLALGFVGPEQTIPDQLGLERDSRSNVAAEYGQYQTNIENVFVAGDMRRGQSLVVWAIHEGRGAARACDGYLMGETFLPF